jgi:hypothetical protein
MNNYRARVMKVLKETDSLHEEMNNELNTFLYSLNMKKIPINFKKFNYMMCDKIELCEEVYGNIKTEFFALKNGFKKYVIKVVQLDLESKLKLLEYIKRSQ